MLNVEVTVTIAAVEMLNFKNLRIKFRNSLSVTISEDRYSDRAVTARAESAQP
jgi:hypothetical protein